MSDIQEDYRDRLDLREQIERIDRARAEGQKLQEETRKFVAEQHKLMAEGDKLTWDRQTGIWIVMASLLSNVMVALLSGVVVAVIAHFWR